MSGLTAAGFSATQYALLSSLYALPGKLVGGISGFIVVAYGYAAFFAFTSLIALPVLVLIYAVGQSPVGGLQPPRKEGEAEGAARPPA
jgi:PAT family beta-lactamase induction signal transducer AmpG